MCGCCGGLYVCVYVIWGRHHFLLYISHRRPLTSFLFSSPFFFFFFNWGSLPPFFFIQFFFLFATKNKKEKEKKKVWIFVRIVGDRQNVSHGVTWTKTTTHKNFQSIQMVLLCGSKHIIESNVHKLVYLLASSYTHISIEKEEDDDDPNLDIENNDCVV